ncbi:MAG: hypothetical protein Crog4KO_10920 [Crocinitomicaceae bacterium]
MSASQLDKVMSEKSDTQLKDIIVDKDGYRLEAREAAIRQLESRSVDVAEEQEQFNQIKTKLVDEAEQQKNRKRRKERFFYIPENAPRTVKVIGILYYALLAIELIQYFVLLVPLVKIAGFNLALVIFSMLPFLLSAFITDGILKGKDWARIVNIVLVGLGLMVEIGNMSVTFSIGVGESEAFGLVTSLIYVTTAILLFVEPSKHWFGEKKEREKRDDLLDDL